MGLEQKYYAVMGLTPSATLDDIKKAYRNKAKQLHPDRNPSPNAEAEFIELQEAYEYIEALHKNGSRIKKDPQIDEFEKWWRAAAQEAERKEKQKRNAQMRYEEYLKSDEYKHAKSLNTIVNFITALFSFFILIVLPIIAYKYGGTGGIVISIIIIFVTTPITLPVLLQLKELKSSIKNLKSAVKTFAGYNWIKIIAQARWLQTLLLVFLNVYLFFKITLNTLVPTYLLFILFPLAIFLGFFIPYTLKKYDKSLQNFVAFCIAPLVINLFFVLNYSISFSPKKESYYYQQKMERVSSRRGGSNYQPTSYIYLENDTYSQYMGLRLFFDYAELKNNDQVTYTFETGLFGVRVMKDYTLENSIIEDDY